MNGLTGHWENYDRPAKGERLTMSDIKALVERLDELYGKATKGPWKLDFKQLVNGDATLLMSYLVGNSTTGPGKTVSMASDRPDDHELVVALVNSWPDLRRALSALPREAGGVPEIITAGPSSLDGLREEVAEIRRRNDTPAGTAPTVLPAVTEEMMIASERVLMTNDFSAETAKEHTKAIYLAMRPLEPIPPGSVTEFRYKFADRAAVEAYCIAEGWLVRHLAPVPQWVSGEPVAWMEFDHQGNSLGVTIYKPDGFWPMKPLYLAAPSPQAPTGAGFVRVPVPVKVEQMANRGVLMLYWDESKRDEVLALLQAGGAREG